MAFIQQIQSLAQLLLPSKAPDTSIINNRADGYGNLAVNTFFNKKQALAAEGSYFVTTNPTPGTAIAGTVSATYSATAPFFIFQNTNQPGGPVAYLDYLKLIVTTAAASGTTAYMAVVRDTLIPQLTTNNMTTGTPVPINTLAPIASKSQFLYQSSSSASVLGTRTPSAAVVGRGSVGGITIVGDELVFDFGALDPAAWNGLTAAQATAPGRKVSVLPPITVAPQQQAIFYLWFLNNASTGLSYEFELCHVEK